jgi:hypothetical protein
MKKLKIVCMLESDPEIRNFLLSRSLEPLFAQHDVTLLLPPNGYERVKFDVASLNLPIPIRHVSIPAKRFTLWRRRYIFDQMRPRLSLRWWRIWSTWLGAIGWKAGVIYGLANLPGVRTIVDRTYDRRLKAVPAEEFAATIRELKPDILIHPSTFGGYFINDMIAEGKAQGIPTMLLMNSWDNPGTKRATSGKADWVAVWGEQTKRHTEFFMGIPSERILKLGAAQFEAYRPAPRLTRAEFRAEHGIAEDMPILLYAGSSRGRKEALHLKWLNEAIENGTLPRVTVLYRPHPWGIARDQAQEILDAGWKHVRIENSMRTFIEDTAAGRKPAGFLMAEYARTHDILSSVDMVISPLSTMIVEGALHGLPAMCFYAQEEEGKSLWTRGVKKLPHFEEIFTSPVVLVCRNYPEFLPKVATLIGRAGDPEFRERIVKEMRYFAEFHPVSYGAAVLEHLDRLFPENDMPERNAS